MANKILPPKGDIQNSSYRIFQFTRPRNAAKIKEHPREYKIISSRVAVNGTIKTPNIWPAIHMDSIIDTIQINSATATLRINSGLATLSINSTIGSVLRVRGGDVVAKVVRGFSNFGRYFSNSLISRS